MQNSNFDRVDDARFSSYLPQEFSEAPVVWIGASSFEPRCVGSLESLYKTDVRVSRVLRVDYTTKTQPEDEARMLIEGNRLRLLDASAKAGCVEHKILAVSGLSAQKFEQGIEQFITSDGVVNQPIIIDVSCFTKMHTITLASLLTRKLNGYPVFIAYTLPQNYTGMAERRQDFEGFQRTIVAPLVDGASLKSESKARGILVLGHEGKRLVVALSEIEPAGGLMLRSMTAARPDFAERTRTRNSRVANRLSTLGGWTAKRMDFGDVASVARLTMAEANLAKSAGGPLLLYPFGPKSFVFTSAYVAAKIYPEGSWFVYPIPTFYDPFTTEGVGTTYWLNATIGKVI